MDETLISIIIPVFNVKDFICRCVDSVISQTYTCIEIILVDDGSDDGSEKICETYKDSDDRIVVYHKINGGLSDARNYGLEKANGELISFIDSDDYVSKDYIETLFVNLVEYNADISGCSFVCFNDNTIPASSPQLKKRIWNSEEALRAMLQQDKYTTSACGLLYKKELFCDIRYPVGKYYEDLGTTYKLLDRANVIINSDAILYFYYKRKGSIQNEEYSNKHFDELLFAKEINDFISEKYPSIYYCAEERLVGVCFHLYFMMEKNQRKTEEAKELKRIIKAKRKALILDKRTSKKVRWGCFFSVFGFRNAEMIYNLLKIRGKIF